MEECDLVEEEINPAEFDGVSVELTLDDDASADGSGQEQDGVMVWSGYMQRDLEPPVDAKASTAQEDVAIYRDNIGAIDPTSQAVTESSASRFFDGNTLSMKSTPMSSLSEWDLRAASETKQWFDRDHAEWQARRRETIGKYPSMASDWRTDVRINESLDPAEVAYKEWSMKEIWDLITMNGQAADPRDVPFQVRKPGSRTNFVAEGYAHHPKIPEWLDMQGKLMRDDDEVQALDADEAILASEFSDFDSDAFEFGGSSSNSDSSE